MIDERFLIEGNGSQRNPYTGIREHDRPDESRGQTDHHQKKPNESDSAHLAPSVSANRQRKRLPGRHYQLYRVILHRLSPDPAEGKQRYRGQVTRALHRSGRYLCAGHRLTGGW